MPHRHLHRRKQGARTGSKEGTSFNYARPWKVFLCTALLVCCIWSVLDVAQEYQYLTAQQNLAYHVNDIDGVDFEHPQVSPDWGFFKKVGNFIKKGVKAVVNTAKKVVKTVKKVVVGAVKFGAAIVNVVGMYLGLKKCVKQTFPIYPAVNPWDLGIVQQANYEKPLGEQYGAFVARANRYLNNPNSKFVYYENVCRKVRGRRVCRKVRKTQTNMEAVEARVFRQWRLLLVRDKTTGFLWVCFRGTTTLSNWIDNARKFFDMGTGKLDSNYREMGKIIVGWQRKYKVRRNSGYNRLYGFIGHSAGGWYANKVAINYDLWRITLNAYDTTKKSRRHVNFRTTKDMVSAMKSMSNYACLGYCAKGHGNAEFVACWRTRYSAYQPNAYQHLWKNTYPGFSGIGAQPASWRKNKIYNEVEGARVVHPAPVQNRPAPRGGALNAPGSSGLTSNQRVAPKTKGWTRVFQCYGDGRQYRDRWFVNWKTLVRRARNNYYQIMFTNPRRKYQWAMSNEFNGIWQTNLANGKALSYVYNGVLSYGWAQQNVWGSLEGLSKNFGYTCSNKNQPNLPGNIYWACGNGGQGFHVMPRSKHCRWSWSARDYQNFAVEMWVKKIGFYPPQAPEYGNPRAKGWTKAYECTTDFGNFQQKWVIPANTLKSRARTNVYAFLFLNPKNQREWVEMSRPRNLFAQNLRAGRALSYNPGCRGNCGLSQGFINGQVRTSYAQLKEHFAYSCGNSRNPRFSNNIYWACGNGENGFHIIPSSKICKWSWSGNYEQAVTMYVKKIGVWNPPKRRPRRSSSSA